VVVGALAARPLSINWGRSFLCVVIALALQIGTNFANDYSDGIRGTDEVRVGPFRLTASKLVPASRVRNASFAWFALAGAAGLGLSSLTSWWLLLVGASAILAGWFYTGGPHPYGYYGLGEVFVMTYFGFAATVGTNYVQHLSINSHVWWLALATGAAACALLEANNLRDIEGDRVAKKHTLASLLGRQRAAWLYGVFVIAMALGAGFGVAVVSGLLVFVLYVPALLIAFSSRTGRELLVLLKVSSQSQLVLGALLVVSLLIVR
jgi:1,4-dihydroxy-2-naphthoate octaprenyltransferase